MATAPPAAPLTVDGEPVPEIATRVTWEGGTLAGTGYAVFPVDVDRLPDGAGPLRFHVIQTDARGGTVEWSDLVPYGAPAPQHPALVVPYSDTPTVPAGSSGHHHEAPDVQVPAADRVAVVDGRARRRRRRADRGGVGHPGQAPAAAVRRGQPSRSSTVSVPVLRLLT